MDAPAITDPSRQPDNPRWFAIAIACLSVHQVQSVVADRGELPFRATSLTVFALSPLTFRLPRRVRGIVWLLIGLPPFGGALAGHLVPIARGDAVPPASETAPLNLAGAALLIALAIALLRSPAAANADPAIPGHQKG